MDGVGSDRLAQYLALNKDCQADREYVGNQNGPRSRLRGRFTFGSMAVATCHRLRAVSGRVARRSGSRQDRPDGVEDEVEPKLELVGVVEAGREQLTADTREVRVRIRRHLGDHR
jgi:hypothetical protein